MTGVLVLIKPGVVGVGVAAAVLDVSRTDVV